MYSTPNLKSQITSLEISNFCQNCNFADRIGQIWDLDYFCCIFSFWPIFRNQKLSFGISQAPNVAKILIFDIFDYKKIEFCTILSDQN